MTTFYCWITKPFEILLCSDGESLIGIYFKGQKYIPTIGSNWIFKPDLALFKKTEQQLGEYTQSTRTTFELPYRLSQGTSFQQKVWLALLDIPHAQTVSYSLLAHRIKAPTSTRAVASAIGKNPLSILIPCHRVIGTDGSLTGYAAGIAMKKQLLAYEQISTR